MPRAEMSNVQPTDRLQLLESSKAAMFPPSALKIRVDCPLLELQSDEPLRRHCAVCRPWYSAYSYIVPMDNDTPMDSCSFPGTLQSSRDVSAHADEAEEIAKSVSSSSGSLEKPHATGSCRRKDRAAPGAKDCITSQDILLASRCQPLPQKGYKCMACCRMFPTLHSLKTHIKCGYKEGFSCKVYYQKAKDLWEK